MKSALPSDLRIGIIGLDTSHVVQFSRLLNDQGSADHVAGAVVVAAFKSGSPDIERSISRVPGFAAELAGRYGVRLCVTIEEMLAQVDAVMIENVDGRKHLEIAKAVFPSRKPVFIDKPLAGTLGQGIELMRLAEQHRVACFSASSLRFAPAIVSLLREERNTLRGATTFSPCELEPHHPDLFWYGVHGVEMLYALLGPGCETVSRVQTAGGDVVTGRWSDGRSGVFHGDRDLNADYGYEAVLPDGVTKENIKPDHGPLVCEIVTFFQTQKAPVSPEEMIEVLTFMEAADESRRRGGAVVSLNEILDLHGGPLAARPGST